jgi:hypothetical protein
MITKSPKFVVAGLLFMVVSFIVLMSGCKEEYVSPNPGTVTVYFRSIYSFTPDFQNNNFPIKLTSLRAIRSDGIAALIEPDEKAFDRKAKLYNTLGRDAFDSTLVIGQYPLPPGEYVALELLIEPGYNVILDGYRYITVERPPNYQSYVLVSNKSFNIYESKGTSVVVTAQLDSVLRKLAYTFEYHTYSDDYSRCFYYISSVN